MGDSGEAASPPQECHHSPDDKAGTASGPPQARECGPFGAAVPGQGCGAHGGGLSDLGTDSITGMHTAPCRRTPRIVLRQDETSPFSVKSPEAYRPPCPPAQHMTALLGEMSAKAPKGGKT